MSEAFEKLELNKLNVLRLMQKCKKTSQTQNVIYARIYSESSDKKSQVLEFDKAQIDSCRYSIRYLLGQLHAVHTQKETMTLSYGLLDYKGNEWTDDQMALWALYYLGIASTTLPQFEKAVNGGFCSPIGIYKALKPTFWPPKDE